MFWPFRIIGSRVPARFVRLKPIRRASPQALVQKHYGGHGPAGQE
jgi:hypothetical protein